jgi:hypothetical protein
VRARTVGRLGSHAHTTAIDVPAALSSATVVADDWPVSMGASRFLIAVGAILYSAVTVDLAGVGPEARSLSHEP